MMEAINKNKEEIEKIKKYVEDSLEQGEYNLNFSILEATIKTSILWCEDEIEFLEKVYSYTESNSQPSIMISHHMQQLQTHLTYLKEQEVVK